MTSTDRIDHAGSPSTRVDRSDTSGTTIRATRLADLDQLLPLHREAFAGTMGVALGRSYGRNFLKRFIAQPDAVSLVAEDDTGRLRGYVFGAPLEAESRTTRVTTPWVILGLLGHPHLFAKRAVTDEILRKAGLKTATTGPETSLPQPTCALVGIGVAADARGTGLAPALVDAFAEAAGRFRARSVHLSVYKDNERARRLYERCGWHPFDHPTNEAVIYYGLDVDPPADDDGPATAEPVTTSGGSIVARLREQVGVQLRHDLPLVAVRVLLDPLPDNQLTMRLRGRLARPFLGSAGPNLQLGRDVTLVGAERLHVGRDVYLAKGCWVNAGGGLTIGDEVMFGPYVVVSTSDHVFRDGSARFTGVSTAPIAIGRGAWVGAHVTLTKGVTVGDGALVAANSAVTVDAPAHMVTGGVPGKPIGPVREHEANAFSRADLT